MVSCGVCTARNACLKRPKTGEALCKECFFHAFEEEVHQTIVQNNVFNHGELVAIAASGGKDSTVLAYLMKLLNDRHDYGLNLVLLSIDEGITGYRDDSLEAGECLKYLYSIPTNCLAVRDILQLKLFISRLSMGPPIEISGLGFFTLSKDFISTFIGAYITYYFLLAQFKDTSINTGH